VKAVVRDLKLASSEPSALSRATVLRTTPSIRIGIQSGHDVK
jgi:hypothetical protein